MRGDFVGFMVWLGSLNFRVKWEGHFSTFSQLSGPLASYKRIFKRTTSAAWLPVSESTDTSTLSWVYLETAHTSKNWTESTFLTLNHVDMTGFFLLGRCGRLPGVSTRNGDLTNSHLSAPSSTTTEEWQSRNSTCHWSWSSSALLSSSCSPVTAYLSCPYVWREDQEKVYDVSKIPSSS